MTPLSSGSRRTREYESMKYAGRKHRKIKTESNRTPEPLEGVLDSKVRRVRWEDEVEGQDDHDAERDPRRYSMFVNEMTGWFCGILLCFGHSRYA